MNDFDTTDICGILRFESLRHPGYIYAMKGRGKTADEVHYWLIEQPNYKFLGTDFPTSYFAFSHPDKQQEFEDKFGHLIHSSEFNEDGDGTCMCEPKCSIYSCFHCKYDLVAVGYKNSISSGLDMKEFDEVRLKSGVTHSCPEGREDNDTAIISYVSDEGEVRTYRDLHGCKWWNVEDLEKV